MPRRGDEANRLGDDYERLWIADSLLDVLAGDARSVTVAAFGPDGSGIDLIKLLPTGAREFHSLKRQTTSETWTLRELSDRSVLDELLAKVAATGSDSAVFVSGTTPNELNELIERANRCQTSDAFEKSLKESPPLLRSFEGHFFPLCNKEWAKAWKSLLRLRVGGMVSSELERRIHQKVRLLVKATGSTPVNPSAVRRLLADLVLRWLGQPVERSAILNALRDEGFEERIFAQDQDVLETVRRLNQGYLADVEADLINGTFIERAEAAKAVDRLSAGETKHVAILGAAGLGKSCVVAQAARVLIAAGTQVLTVRLDCQNEARTAEQLGRDLGLPESPAIVLAGLVSGGPSVLVLDQLDALSTASGRNPHLWTALSELLREADAYPSMRVLLACREFDAEYDQRLRRLFSNEQKSERIFLRPLTQEEVQRIVAKAGMDFAVLGPRQVDLLKTPQHLSLFLHGALKGRPPFHDLKELFDRYWDAKQNQVRLELGREPRWMDVVRKLSGWLSAHQTLAAPADVLDEAREDAMKMASASVLAFDGRRWRFFHETFFDYCFARVFASAGQRLTTLLLEPGQEQHLFRRAQVRQILGYQRDRDFQTYLAELRDLLGEQRIRFHLKKLTLDWLRNLEMPTAEEWRVLAVFTEDSRLGRRVRMVPHNSVGWFDVLQRERVWLKWLTSSDEDCIDHAVFLIGLPRIMQARSIEVAALVTPFVEDSPSWQRRFVNLARSGRVYHSREMFDLFMRKFRNGWFDDTDEHWWYRFNAMAEEAPLLALELLDAYLDRWLADREPDKNGDAFTIEREQSLPPEFLQQLEERIPCEVGRQLLPKIVAAVRLHAVTAESGKVRDKIWGWRSLGFEHGFGESVLGLLSTALAKMAIQRPDEFATLTEQHKSLPHDTVVFLLLNAWSKNGEHFADEIATYLLADLRRLDVGYTSWGTGDGRNIVSRAALRALGPHCNADLYLRIEDAISVYAAKVEVEHPTSAKYRELMLLECLPPARMSAGVRRRFNELLLAIPDADFSTPRPPEDYCVVSPVPPEDRARMPDEELLETMRTFSGSRQKGHGPQGGMEQLASTLGDDARKQKTRFATLLLKMPSDLPENYFGCILDGLVETKEEGSDPERHPEATKLLESERLFEVLRRIHSLPRRPCGRRISWAIGKFGKHQLPDDILEMVAHYAIHDPDPTQEVWQQSPGGGGPGYGGDPELAGFNCNRGAAAHAIARLLFEDSNRWSRFETTVATLTTDSSLAVRCMALECLTACLNVDRDTAVAMFLRLAEGADAILGTHNAEQFFHYATFSHYNQLQPVLIRLLSSVEAKANKTAARCITVSFLWDKASGADFELAASGNVTSRAAVADVLAEALGHEAVRARCSELLPRFFNDPEKEVRKATCDCFRHRTGEVLLQEKNLIHRFIRSPAFNDNHAQLCLALRESNDLLPDVTLAIPERIIQLHRTERGNASLEVHRDVLYIPELVIRLYQQAADADLKTRCLDLLDEMLSLEVSMLDELLAKTER